MNFPMNRVTSGTNTELFRVKDTANTTRIKVVGTVLPMEQTDRITRNMVEEIESRWIPIGMEIDAVGSQ